MNALNPVLAVISSLSGTPALLVAAGFAAALILTALAVVITATKNRITININLGRDSSPP